MKIYTNDCGLGKAPESRVFAHMWTQVLNEYMREFNYMANCASMDFSVAPGLDHINMQWSGFDDSMIVYIEESLNQLTTMAGKEALADIFTQAKDKLLMDWSNFYLEQSYQQAFTLFDVSTVNSAFELKSLKKILESYSFEEFQTQHG